MLLQAPVGLPRSAHVIVLGNEKGGSGKSTTSMHVIVALMKGGQRVASIDLDSRQKSLTHYVENRRAWAERAGIELEQPTHHHIVRASGAKVEQNEAAEFACFAEAITTVEHCHDFVVIDTPPNDSFLDFDVLGSIDPETFAVTGIGHYAEMAREARRQRRLVDGGLTDWVVIRNRLSTLGSRNKRLVGESLNELGLRLGFRLAEGFGERVIYREFFPRGLTALDTLDIMAD